MRYLILTLCVFLSSCIKVSHSDLNVYRYDSHLAEKTAARQSQGFWEAMQHLDLDFARNFPDSSEEAQFSTTLESMVSGNYLSASSSLEHLVQTSRDSLMVKHAGTLLTGIYTLRFDWDALLWLDSLLPNGIDDMNTIAMVEAWNSQAAETIDYSTQPITIPMEKSISGVPVISVMVNGVAQKFWIDTGAEFTVLSSDIAAKCGVEPLITESSKVGTSTSKKIDLWPGMITELKIEDLVFKNHPVFIISKEDLEFRLLKIFKILKIDGILGWNAIHNLKLEIDYARNLVTFSKPEDQDYPARNFHFLTEPYVTVQDTNGIAFNFFLDTGANRTNLYEPSFAFFDTSRAKRTRAIAGGAGGAEKIRQLMLQDQSLLIAGTRIDFGSISGESSRGDSGEGFLQYDGILGSDIARHSVLTLDFHNGWCGLSP